MSIPFGDLPSSKSPLAGMDDAETLHRRARYRELLRECFADKPSGLLEHIAARGFTANQGEISALKKDNGAKSFGDKKARVLAEQIGLHRRWFDWPLGTHLDRRSWTSALPDDQEQPQDADPVASLPSDEQTLINAYRVASDEMKSALMALASSALASRQAVAHSRRKLVMPSRVDSNKPKARNA